MLEIPFAFQWTIPENRLISLKDSLDDEFLYSTDISNIPGLKYYLKIYPNGENEESRGETWIYLYLKLKNVKKVCAEWNFSIETANLSKFNNEIFDENCGMGTNICETRDFFDPEEKYFVDGKCTIKVNGTFEFENEILLMPEIGQKRQQKWVGGDLGDQLWAKDNVKDFKIIVDGKIIKVHKLILDAQSNVFSAMLNTPKMKESIESKVVIPDFSFNVVKTAVKLIYNCNFTSSLTFDDQLFLLQFIDKYDLPKLKDKVEQFLINQISASNVCRLTNCSIFTNSENLKNNCIRFLMASLASKNALAEIEILDKEIAFKILQNSLCQIVEIDDDC